MVTITKETGGVRIMEDTKLLGDFITRPNKITVENNLVTLEFPFEQVPINVDGGVTIGETEFEGSAEELSAQLRDEVFFLANSGGEVPENVAVTDVDNNFSAKQTFQKQLRVDGQGGVVKAVAVLGASGDGYGGVGYNVEFQTASNAYKRVNTGFADYANMIFFENGHFSFRRAPTGAGGSDITWSEMFRVDFGGNIEIVNADCGIVAKSANGTRYKLIPPDGGGAATWVTV